MSRNNCPNIDSDSRPKTSDNRLKVGNGKRLHEEKGMAVSRSIGTFGILGYEKIPKELGLGVDLSDEKIRRIRGSKYRRGVSQEE